MYMIIYNYSKFIFEINCTEYGGLHMSKRKGYVKKKEKNAEIAEKAVFEHY